MMRLTVLIEDRLVTERQTDRTRVKHLPR